MEYWNGVLEWSTGMEYWNGVLGMLEHNLFVSE